MVCRKPSLFVVVAGITMFVIGCTPPPADSGSTGSAGTNPPTTSDPTPKTDGGTSTPMSTVDFEKDLKPVIAKTCLLCHSGPQAKGHIDMTLLQTNDDAKINKAMLVKMLAEVEGGKMPPKKVKPITDEERAKIVELLKGVTS